MKHYKSVEFYHFQNDKTLHKPKAPLIKTFWRRFLIGCTPRQIEVIETFYSRLKRHPYGLNRSCRVKSKNKQGTLNSSGREGRKSRAILLDF